MAENYRSAMGKNIDMAALRAQNERVRAVGNMNVNARGDTIDSNGNVIQDNNKRVNEYYMKAVMNRAARGVQQGTSALSGKPQPAKPPVDVTPVIVAEPEPETIQLTAEEQLFEQEDAEVELPVKSKKNTSK